MTNNYEENILKGVRDSSYSLESSIELLQKDVVQLHAPRYQSMRRVSSVLSLDLVSLASLSLHRPHPHPQELLVTVVINFFKSWL